MITTSTASAATTNASNQILATTAATFKPKKSVALSGVTAGNTALCTVGKTSNDLHYRGYDILDIAEVCEFEEIAHLLVHGKLPTHSELKAYKTKLKSLRVLPTSVKTALEQLPAASHPMDVMRTGVAARGCALPEKDDYNLPGARDIADPDGSLGSMLLYWFHSALGPPHRVETMNDSSRPLPASAARRQTCRELCARHAHLFEPVCRARVQCLHLHGARGGRHGQRYVLRHYRRDWRTARPQARRCQRSGIRDPETL